VVVGSPPHNPKGIPPMYEKLDMNYGRVLYESGKREEERTREKSIKLYMNDGYDHV
jgi:hypothetical protein